MDCVGVNPELCDGCGQCMQVCVVECIRIEAGKAVVGPDCIVCMACASVCPQDAIVEPRRPQRPVRSWRPPLTRCGPAWSGGLAVPTGRIEPPPIDAIGDRGPEPAMASPRDGTLRWWRPQR